mmetsp:Transcript_81/g.192  ORF Transcript_81/g.192 Transcript_81/m.192 type:complete len:411 (-) Transcript_81:116-1348(-)
MSLHDHLIVPELLGHVPRTGARDFDPRLGEEGAGRENEDQIKHRVKGVVNDLGEGSGRRDVVGDASDGDGGSASLDVLPFAQDAHQDVGGCAVVEELGDEVEVGDQGGLEDDGHVGGVEELDGVGALLSAVLLVLDGEDDAPALEVDDHDEDEDGGHEIGEVGQVLAVDRLLDGADLVGPREQEVEQGHNGALELRAAARVDGGGAEGLPHDVLADVGGDEETDARAQAVPLLQQLVQREHDESGAEQLGDDQQGVSRPDGRQVAVHAGHHVGDGLAHRDEDAEELLRPGEEGAVLLDVVVDLDDATARQELHDQAGRDDGRDAQLHEGAAVGGQDDAHPVEGVGRLGGLDAVDGDLAAHQEDEQGDGRPQHFFTERDLAIGRGHLGQHAHHGTDQVEKPHDVVVVVAII